MNSNRPFDDQAIQALLENLPMSERTPESLRTKLADLAASPQPRHRAVRRPVVAMAFAGALTVAAVAVFLSIPATAKSWSLVKQAVQRVKTMQMEIRELDRAKPEWTRVAFGDRLVLVESPEGTIVYVSNGTVQIYEPKENVVREFPMPEGIMPEIMGQVVGEISMTKILAEHEREFGKENIKIGPSRMWQGRRVFDVTFTKPEGAASNDGDDRVNIVADEATDLPILIEVFKKENGNLKKTNEIVARYNDAVTPENLRPNFPPGVKFEKFDISKIMDGKGEPPDIDIDF